MLHCNVQVFDAEGKFLHKFDGASGGTEESKISRVAGHVACDTAGNWLVVDINCVKVFSPAGAFITRFSYDEKNVFRGVVGVGVGVDDKICVGESCGRVTVYGFSM